MSDVIARIHQDHVIMSRLLDALSEHVDQLRAPGVDPDLNLMVDIVSYYNSFADVIHHPLEDELFTAMANHDAALDPTLKELKQQHRAFPEQVKPLSDMLEAAAAGQFVVRDDLVAAADNYISLIRKHMNIEETEVLGVVDKFLTPAELATIEHHELAQHPLFGATLHDTFEKMLATIREQL